MTPGARVAAAIAVLDQIQGGAAAEQALTAWARGSRYAGSKDRAAVRDHVFDVLRAKRSLGDGAGRDLMLRLAQRENWDLDSLFSGEGHAPAKLADEDKAALAGTKDISDAACLDLPEWLWPQWQESLGDQAEPVALIQQERASVFLRVNGRNGSVDAAMASLQQHGVGVVVHPVVEGCLRVTENPRKVKTSDAYLNGLVELQDAASQAAVRRVPVHSGATILDYCAGGGGKSLAFADHFDATVTAHDIASQRMRDLPARAERAGVDIEIVQTADLTAQKYDIVFCDAPCSGSGTWRRTPDAKWRFTADRLNELVQLQREVIFGAARHVREGGMLIYATCSVLQKENTDLVQWFIDQDDRWRIDAQDQRLPDSDGDGFFTCVLMQL